MTTKTLLISVLFFLPVVAHSQSLLEAGKAFSSDEEGTHSQNLPEKLRVQRNGATLPWYDQYTRRKLKLTPASELRTKNQIISWRIFNVLNDNENTIQFKRIPGYIGSNYTTNCLPLAKNAPTSYNCTFKLSHAKLSALKESTYTLRSSTSKLVEGSPEIAIYKKTSRLVQFYLKSPLADDYAFQECTFHFDSLGFFDSKKMVCVLVYHS